MQIVGSLMLGISILSLATFFFIIKAEADKSKFGFTLPADETALASLFSMMLGLVAMGVLGFKLVTQ